MTSIYLASPYTHPNLIIRELRFRAVAAATAHLIAFGEAVFSPILHCHQLVTDGKFLGTFEAWQEYNEIMISVHERFGVLHLPGWDRSKGIASEMLYAAAANKNCQAYNPFAVGVPHDILAILEAFAS